MAETAPGLLRLLDVERDARSRFVRVSTIQNDEASIKAAESRFGQKPPSRSAPIWREQTTRSAINPLTFEITSTWTRAVEPVPALRVQLLRCFRRQGRGRAQVYEAEPVRQ